MNGGPLVVGCHRDRMKMLTLPGHDGSIFFALQRIVFRACAWKPPFIYILFYCMYMQKLKVLSLLSLQNPDIFFSPSVPSTKGEMGMFYGITYGYWSLDSFRLQTGSVFQVRMDPPCAGPDKKTIEVMDKGGRKMGSHPKAEEDRFQLLFEQRIR